MGAFSVRAFQMPHGLVWFPLLLLALFQLQTVLGADRVVSPALFAELEEMSRFAAASYCVGNQGIERPFKCGGKTSWCQRFEGVRLVETWDLGQLDSASCGYVALASNPPRVVVAFRGSNSLSDTLYDLMTQPAAYTPYGGGNSSERGEDRHGREDDCADCAVHAGFMYLWDGTRDVVVPVVKQLLDTFPDHQLVVTGHSLGGAVAGLAALDFVAKGWDPTVTTFGEPRFGNEHLAAYVDVKLHDRYRRVTHAGDPVPLLPFEKWGWSMHNGEIFIDSETLPVAVSDVRHCVGQADPECIRGTSKSDQDVRDETLLSHWHRLLARVPEVAGIPGLPDEWRLWEILFAHRQYFWRIGLCWDPQDYDYVERSEPRDDEL